MHIFQDVVIYTAFKVRIFNENCNSKHTYLHKYQLKTFFAFDRSRVNRVEIQNAVTKGVKVLTTL